MRNVDVYGAGGTLMVFINGEEYKKVLAVNPPSHDSFASVELAVDGKITYHGDVKPPVNQPMPMPYDWARDYQTLRERLSTAVSKGAMTQAVYDKITHNLHDI